ncbi:hypothetical protein N656DRAFT_794539 [Canariomyces notabilis]|uniref:YDG domain-containing protein n=1 Tax=Canariomyces notabilis TaxID=2074819 RepID=A0AAN6TKK8_9PEZI|nr:hypothetical protein N656DRAFT_794539 [Canariomyces arenarius]
MQGIHGSVEHGAYPTAVPGKATAYTGDLGDDRGDGTKCLRASLRTGNPVRVLRSTGPKKALAPSVEIRYT